MVKQRIDVTELVIWTIQRQRADVIIEEGRGLLPQERAAAGIEVRTICGDGCYQIAMNGAIGTNIDGGGPSLGDLHPDAEATYLAMQALGGPWFGILLDYGRSGIVPDWMPGAVPISRPKLKPNGKIKMRYDRNKNPIGYEMEDVLLQEEIDFARKKYEYWWDALNKLTVDLKKHGLKSHEINFSITQRCPWIAT